MGKFCSKCGKEGKANAKFCEFCGNQMVEETVTTVESEPVTPRNGMALAGFILSFFVPVLGLIFSIIGAAKAPRLNGDRKGLAIAGIIISAITIVVRIFFGFGMYAGILEGLSSYYY